MRKSFIFAKRGLDKLKKINPTNYCPCDNCNYRGSCETNCVTFNKYTELKSEHARKENYDRFVKLKDMKI